MMNIDENTNKEIDDIIKNIGRCYAEMEEIKIAIGIIAKRIENNE